MLCSKNFQRNVAELLSGFLKIYSYESKEKRPFKIQVSSKAFLNLLKGAFIQGVPPICWQVRTKFWKLKNHICQKVRPVLKFLRKKLLDGALKPGKGQWRLFFLEFDTFFILNLKILPIWFSQVSRCHLKAFNSMILKHGLLFAICDFSIFKI